MVVSEYCSPSLWRIMQAIINCEPFSFKDSAIIIPSRILNPFYPIQKEFIKIQLKKFR